MRYLCLVMLLCLLLPLQANEPQHIRVARSYLFVREKTGKNDGEPIESWQRYVGVPKGNPYCAAFVSFCLGKAKVREPLVITGLACSFITKKSIRAIDVFKGKAKAPDYSIVIWKRGNSYHGHTGFALVWHGIKGGTIEANTSSGIKGQQDEGDGVYQKTREIQPYSYFRITYFTRVLY